MSDSVLSENVKTLKANIKLDWFRGYNWLKEKGYFQALADDDAALFAQGNTAANAADPANQRPAKYTAYRILDEDAKDLYDNGFYSTNIHSSPYSGNWRINRTESGWHVYFRDWGIAPELSNFNWNTVGYLYPFGRPFDSPRHRTAYSNHTTQIAIANDTDIPINLTEAPGGINEEIINLTKILAQVNRYIEPTLGIEGAKRTDKNDYEDPVYWPAHLGPHQQRKKIIAWVDAKFKNALLAGYEDNLFLPSEAYADRLRGYNFAQILELEKSAAEAGPASLASDPSYYAPGGIYDMIKQAEKAVNTGIPFPVYADMIYTLDGDNTLWSGEEGPPGDGMVRNIAVFRCNRDLLKKNGLWGTKAAQSGFTDRDFALWTQEEVEAHMEFDGLQGFFEKLETRWDNMHGWISSWLGTDKTDAGHAQEWSREFLTVLKAKNLIYKNLGIYSSEEFAEAEEEINEKLEDLNQRADVETSRGKIDLPAFEEDLPKAASIWDQQCFLIENIRAITSAAQNRRYPNLINLSAPPGNIVSQLQHGLEDGAVQQLLNLTPAQHALLVPYVRLYRVVYDPKNPLIPIGEAPLPFKNFTTTDDIDAITDGKIGRQGGAGIKSFQWSLQGVQPAEVDNNIVATLNVYFQSMYDLFKPTLEQIAGGKLEDIQSGLENPSFLDLIMAPESIPKVQEGAIEDRANQQEEDCFDGPRKVYDGVYYRIKAVVGWSLPDAKSMESIGDLGSSQVKKLEEALESQRTTLYLQLARHEIDVNDDGSINLLVHYQGALSGMMRSERADILANEKALENPFKDPNSELSQLRAASIGDAGLTPEQESRYKDLLQVQADAEGEDRLVRYRRVLKQLYNRGLINTIRLPMKELLAPAWDKLTPEQREKRAKRRQSKNDATRGFEINPGGPIGLSAETDPLYTALGEVTGELDRDEENQLGNSLNTLQNATPADVVDINYMYLGDLISSILDQPHLQEQVRAGAFAMALGTVELIDPLIAYGNRSISEESKCKDVRQINVSRAFTRLEPLSNLGRLGVVEQMLISNIPISLDAFNEWFLQHVIKKDRTKYYLDYFVKDVLDKLVSNALGPGCFPGIPNVPVRFATNEFLVERAQKLNGASPVSMHLMRHLTKSKGDVSIARDRNMERLVPTQFVYSSDSLPQGTGVDNPVDDRKQGIYHFYLGASAGLVKKITFERQDQPFLREAKIQRFGSFGATQLREYYGVSMKMVGNTLLKNGQYIYINPSLMGLGSPAATAGFPNLAKLLGLGGYFLVTGVEHMVDSKGFDVTVKALHEAMRKPVAQTVPQESVTETIEENIDEEKTQDKKEEKPKPPEKPPTKKPPEPKKKENKRGKFGGELYGPGNRFELVERQDQYGTSLVIYDNLLDQFGKALDPSQTTSVTSGFYDPYSQGLGVLGGSQAQSTDMLMYGPGGREYDDGTIVDAYNPETQGGN